MSSSKCPVNKCDGTGIILVDYPPNGYYKDYNYPHTVSHRCECSGKSSAEFRRSRAYLPYQYSSMKGKDFDWNLYNCDVTKQKMIVNDFIINFTDYEKSSKGLYVYSRTKGSGKTMLSAVIANELMDRISMSVKFVTVLDLLELVKKNYKSGDYNDEIAEFYKARLLILDDIGTEIKKEHTDMVLFQLINERCNKKLTTIFTSNLAIENLSLDERTIDRINSMAIMINIPDVPVRKNKTEKENMDFLYRNREKSSKTWYSDDK